MRLSISLIGMKFITSLRILCADGLSSEIRAINGILAIRTEKYCVDHSKNPESGTEK